MLLYMYTDRKELPHFQHVLVDMDSLQEYTEEIDRLKRDLMATRDKNGIFLSPENYL